jgi:hypothetical protein
MGARKWIAVAVVLAVVALFVPLVPQTLAAGSIARAHYQRTAVVSPSYYVFHCGSYVNAQVSVQLTPSISSLYQAGKAYTFSCEYTSA